MLYELPNGNYLTLTRVTGAQLFNDSAKICVVIDLEQNRGREVCFDNSETARNWMRQFVLEVNKAKSEAQTFADLSSVEISRLKALLHKDN